MFTVSDEKLDSEGRPGNKAVEEVVCTGYKNASYILSYRWASLIREHIEVIISTKFFSPLHGPVN